MNVKVVIKLPNVKPADIQVETQRALGLVTAAVQRGITNGHITDNASGNAPVTLGRFSVTSE